MENKKKKYGNKKDILLVNSITGLRFIASFLVVPVFQALGGVGAAIFSAIFLATDAIDGGLARKKNASTFFGSIFDGVTDKIFAVLALAILMTINPVIFGLPILIELGIIAVQNAKMQNGLNVKSNLIGKLKTCALSASMVASFIAIDLLNMPLFLDYLKNFSLDKVASIRDLLILLGINLPTIVLQLLTINSYKKELKKGKEEYDELLLKDLNNLTNKDKEELMTKLNEEDKEILKEYLGENRKTPEERLKEIDSEREKLIYDLNILDKAKAINEKLFDPEYYDQNKDRQLRVLTKELFEDYKKRG